MTDEEKSTAVTAMLRVINIIGYVSTVLWVIMALFVGNALADHRNEPHASAASKEELADVRLDVARNAQKISSDDKFDAAMRTQNAIDHRALNDLIVAQNAMIDKIWGKVK